MGCLDITPWLRPALRRSCPLRAGDALAPPSHLQPRGLVAGLAGPEAAAAGPEAHAPRGLVTGGSETEKRGGGVHENATWREAGADGGGRWGGEGGDIAIFARVRSLARWGPS